ncbi:MAG: hypothetical protein ABTR07_08370 [Candidatus Competibacter denitrificans]
MAMNALSLIGDLLLGPLAGAGALPLYYFDPLNATKLTLQPGKVDKKERIGRGLTTNGTALNVLTKVAESATITVTNDEFRAEILALQLRGFASKLAQTGATLTDQELVVKLDQYVPLPANHLANDAVTAKLKSAPATTYTENTHFLVDRQAGLIKFLSGVAGAPADGVAVLVTMKTATHNRIQVSGSNSIPSRFAVLYNGINQASGKRCLLRVPQGVIAPDGNLELITDAFVEGNLLITPELVTGQAAAYYYEEDE